MASSNLADEAKVAIMAAFGMNDVRAVAALDLQMGRFTLRDRGPNAERAERQGRL